MSPLVSVIMPVFNAEKFLYASIGSILAQTYQNFELIIINDGSSDRSMDVVRSIKDSRLIIIDNAVNQGTAAASNQGIDMAKGDFIALMDADDYSLPDRLQKQVDYLSLYNNVGVLGTAYMFSDSKKILRYPAADAQIRADMFFYYPFRNSSLMFRGDVIKNAGLRFDASFKHTLDYEFVSRVIGHTRCANLEDTLLIYTVHENQISRTQHEVFVAHGHEVAIRMLRYMGIFLNQRERELWIAMREGNLESGALLEADNLLTRIGNCSVRAALFDQVNFRHVADRMHPIRREIMYQSKLGFRRLFFLMRFFRYFRLVEIMKYSAKGLLQGF